MRNKTETPTDRLVKAAYFLVLHTEELRAKMKRPDGKDSLMIVQWKDYVELRRSLKMRFKITREEMRRLTKPQLRPQPK